VVVKELFSEVPSAIRRGSRAALSLGPRGRGFTGAPERPVHITGEDLGAALESSGIRVQLTAPKDPEKRFFTIGGGAGIDRVWLIIGDSIVGMAATYREPGDLAGIGVQASWMRSGGDCSVILSTETATFRFGIRGSQSMTLRFDIPDPWLEADVRFVVGSSFEET
jgi:hypothetical protein